MSESADTPEPQEPAAQASESQVPEAQAPTAQESAAVSPEAQKEPEKSSKTAQGALTQEECDAIAHGYAFEAQALELGVLVNGEAMKDVAVRIPLAMLNRHGIIAGATGTGKTRTLQLLAEQLSHAGVSVFAADVKGDLSGVSQEGAHNEKLDARIADIGQEWTASAFPTEFFSLGGAGNGIPVRATLDGFGSVLLSRVLGLNDTQESSLALVFHFAKSKNLPLIDLDDLRAVLLYLTSDAAKGELASLGGLSAATAGVILRELIAFSDQGASEFFGEPAIDTLDFVKSRGSSGVISLLELPSVQDKPLLYSTFLMWFLGDLFRRLPEVGDTDKPKLVFFFDEAHLLFKDASKEFLAHIVQTVRLVRSKAVGVFFVTQTPKDIPADVLSQLGSRIQHQLRAFTPDDAKALKATVSTYPSSSYELDKVLTSLGNGEAIVTVMNEKGAPSPVAWTRLRAPQGSMAAADAEEIAKIAKASDLAGSYAERIDSVSAKEMLEKQATESIPSQAETPPDRGRDDTGNAQGRTSGGRPRKTVLEQVLSSPTTKSVVSQVVRGLLSVFRKR